MERNRMNPTRQAWYWSLIVVMLMAVAACDATQNEAPEAEAQDAELLAVTEALAADLNLTADQARDLRSAFAGQDAANPGRLWAVAARMNERLTDEQKARLLGLVERLDSQRAARTTDRAAGDHPRMRDRLRGLEDVLTDAQKESLAALRTEMRSHVESLRQQKEAGSLSEDAFREQMKVLMAGLRTQIEALLTDEQKAALEQKKAERGEEMKARRAAANEARAEALGLTEEQRTALKEAAEALHETLKALHEQRQNGDREALRAAVKEARDDFRATTEQVLTEDQKTIVALHKALAFRMFRARHDRAGAQGDAGPARRGFRHHRGG